ncbi:MAG: molecular chaperone TorD family protein [Pseudomonadota bacterium]|nr:molecular chaperone TorD family protein [Pseudomonadota bacterium]
MSNNQDIARSAIYKYLSLAIDYPIGETAEILSSGALFTELSTQLQKLSTDFQSLTGNLSPLKEELSRFETLEDIQVVYTRFFDMAVKKPSFSLYETANVMATSEAEKTAAFLVELEAVYGREGITLSDRDMPDHLATELEFMHFLCANGKTGQQADFLTHHLNNWLPQLAQSFLKQETIPFYSRLIMLIAHFVETDQHNLQS